MTTFQTNRSFDTLPSSQLHLNHSHLPTFFPELHSPFSRHHQFSSVLQQAVQQSRSALLQFRQHTEFADRMTIAFGHHYDAAAADQFFDAFATRSSGLPHLEILSNDALSGAYGAYAQATDTVYLSQQLIAGGNIHAIAAVLIEELGHSLDARINPVDARGDEGEIFSRLVRQQFLSSELLNRLQAEDDSGYLQVGDRRVSIEQAQDFNQDNQTDLLWRNYSTGEVGAWLMNSTQVQGWTSMSTVSELTWCIEGTGDFNGDGKIDILWRNDRNGQIGTWLMNGAQVQGWVSISTVADLNWQIEGTGDFNGDGKIDILW
ncbi:MAG: VCBS repeat-containing protein, partial [Synechococcales bacterium]|nr:VCBS repeat-containing protein [Synechococcales bacterium]